MTTRDVSPFEPRARERGEVVGLVRRIQALFSSSRSSGRARARGRRCTAQAALGQARRPRATCCLGEEASSSSYRGAKRAAISAQS
jgi:hypothetical protein